MSRIVTLAAVASLAATTAVAQTSDAPPDLASVHQKMEQFVADHEIAGAVTLVTEAGRVVHLDATGKADVALDRPMRPDTIFWIASMTKPITGTAVLMMQEEGKLSVDDLVSKHIPAFADLKTKDGKPANLTIRHLLTHTSGLGEMSGGPASGVKTLAEAIPFYLEKPVAFEPGSKWAYCQSGINTAARIVEVSFWVKPCSSISLQQWLFWLRCYAEGQYNASISTTIRCLVWRRRINAPTRKNSSPCR